MKERSPFTPGHPVPPEYFVGRQEELKRLQRAIEQVYQGKNENIFLTGERGIGKSSLASLCKTIALEKYRLFGAHCYLDPAKDVPHLCALVIQRLLEEKPEQSFFEKVKKMVERYVEVIGIRLFGISAEIRIKRDTSEDLPMHFLPILKGFYNILGEEYKGLVVILDNLNGITALPEVALFLKSFIDELAGKLPLLFCLVGVEERMSDLVKVQPSVARIFNTIELTPMNEAEGRQFFEKAFGKVGVTFKEDALDLMVRYSGGMPALLHEIGDATYWEDIDGCISREDAIKGIISAAGEVGKKYFDRQVFEEIRSDARRKLLLKIVKSTKTMLEPIRRKDIASLLAEDERRDFDNLLRRMERLDILKKGDQRGEYLYLNKLFPVYVRMILLRRIEKSINQKVQRT